MEIRRWGWDAGFAGVFAEMASTESAAAEWVPARVLIEHRSRYIVRTEIGECDAVIAGRLRHEESDPAALPAVGDWVAVRLPGEEGPAVIQAVLPRRTRFSRGAAGTGAEQVVAANIDRVFLVSALDADLNERRIERYLTLAWDSGADPVIVLTKADIATGIEPDLSAIALGVPIIRVSAIDGTGLDGIHALLEPGRTIALLGSSGVGKSTLINAILGESRMRTAAVREDGKGRHTTTHRELVMTPDGALLLDTPGMREIQLWTGAEQVVEAFDDIAALAADCRFSDCAHDGEPGCAVARAIEDGAIPVERLASYHKLAAEARYLDSRDDPQARTQKKRSDRIGSKALQAQLRRKYE